MSDYTQIMMTDVAKMEQEHAEKAYQAFTEKFEPKKTTDDCYTPPLVMDAVNAWVASEYHRDPATFVRPFWPGADYQAQEYPPGCVVVDNPPFSILSQIIQYYCDRGIDFFLFAQAITLFNVRILDGVCYIPTDSDITYENGAKVRTGFITSLDAARVRSAPALYRAIKAAVDETRKNAAAEIPKYIYPDHLITSAVVQRYSHYGIDFRVMPWECVRVPALDAQRETGKSIFGGGFLLSDRAAADRAAADRTADYVAAERVTVYRWELSARERAIVAELSAEAEKRAKA